MIKSTTIFLLSLYLMMSFADDACEISKVTTVLASGSTTTSTLTETSVSSYYLSLTNVPFENALDATLHAADDISDTPGFSTFGGDAGEFLLALQVLKVYFNIKFANSLEILPILRRYVNVGLVGRPFEMKFDSQTALKWRNYLVSAGAVVSANFPKELDDTNAQTLALPCLKNASFISDLHIQQLLLHADLYAMDKEIVTDFLEAFFLSLWNSEDSTPLLLDVQQATTTTNSNPVALINIKNIASSAGKDCDELSPQFVHSINSNRVIVVHETVLEQQRKEVLSPYFAAQYGLDVNNFTFHINQLATFQYQTHLANDLSTIPTFNTTITGGYSDVTFNTYFIAIAVVLVGILCIIGASMGIYSNHKKHRDDERKKEADAKKLRASRRSQDIELSPMSGYRSSSSVSSPVTAHTVVPLEADKNEVIDMQA